MKKLLVFVCAVTFLLLSLNVQAAPLSDEYVIEVSTTQLGPYSWNFEYKITNINQNAPQDIYTGLGGFQIEIPEAAVISNVTVPDPYHDPYNGVAGYWTYGIEDTILWYWGNQPASVYPMGSTAIFSFQADGVVLGDNIWSRLMTYWGTYEAPISFEGPNNPGFYYTRYATRLVGPAPISELPPYHLDYCRDFRPCAEGEGDCDNDSECENGLTCVQIPGEVDVCEAPDVCPYPIGHWDYCRDCGPCTEGEGDCDTDNECASGLVCDQIIGAADFCKPSCPHPIGHWDYCRDCGPCGAGQGDCDFDSECQSGMICAQVIGAADVCCPHPIGHWDYCRDCGPCDLGQGDCDNDSECRGGLVCAQVTGAVDVCESQSSQ